MRAFWGLDHWSNTILLHTNNRDRAADGLDLLANIGLIETFRYRSHNE